MHNAAFEHLGMDWCYVTFPVRPNQLGDAVKAIRALDLKGVNITVPHKENVMPLLDRVNEEASFIGAVNTIQNDDGTLIGYNTDGRGFMESLSEAGISLEGKHVLIIGAGGACRAISYYLSEKVSTLSLFDLDAHKAEKLIHDFSAIRTNMRRVKSLALLNEMDIIINATPLGLKNTDPIPVDISSIRGNMIVCELITRDTPLLKAASTKGCKTINGLGMLLHQGVIAFNLWTGVMPPLDVMRNALR